MPHCIAVIDPAISSPATTGFNKMSMLSPLPLTHHLPFLHGISSLLALNQDDIAGAIILGSNTSVNTSGLHQDLFVSWLKRFCERKRPIFGICYGHQLLAAIFGGQVSFMRSDRQKLSGLRDIEVLDDARLGIEARQQRFVVSHNEVVTAVPDCFDVFARSADIPYDGLRHRQLPIWTLQAHTEATQEFLYDQKIDLYIPPEVERLGFDIVVRFLSYCHKCVAG